jgi:hypothetical protein
MDNMAQVDALTSSATAKVFKLRDEIIYHLEAQHLISLQRVNSAFLEATLTLPVLRQQLFLSPISSPPLVTRKAWYTLGCHRRVSTTPAIPIMFFDHHGNPEKILTDDNVNPATVQLNSVTLKLHFWDEWSKEEDHAAQEFCGHQEKVGTQTVEIKKEKFEALMRGHSDKSDSGNGATTTGVTGIKNKGQAYDMFLTQPPCRSLDVYWVQRGEPYWKAKRVGLTSKEGEDGLQIKDLINGFQWATKVAENEGWVVDVKESWVEFRDVVVVCD